MEQKKYKVEFIETEKYVIDVLADNEEKAIKIAEIKRKEYVSAGTMHYFQEGDTETKTGTIYDVTNTDDPHNP